MATRYGSDPKEIAARDHKYLDRGAESRVYLRNNDFVIKVRRLDAYDMDGVKHALAKIVYHNYLFPKDAYRLQDIAVWKNERGFDEYYMILEQPLVTPKRDAGGNIIAPSRGHIIQALKKTGQKFNITGGYHDNGDTSSGSSSGDVVESAKMVAASGDYAVYDFKPGRNTFLDAETGEVRFIDPRVDINDPTDNFAYSKFGKRRRTDAGFDADRQIGNLAAAKKDAGESPWTAEDEARYREQEEANAILDDADFNGQPSRKGEGKLAVGGQVVGDWVIGEDGTIARRVTPEEDAAYTDAVKRGDKDAYLKMLRDVAARRGYSDDSSYQGTSAFNGAAPGRNAYFETKQERIEATKRGDMEDTTTLGDFRDGIDLNNLQFIVFDPRLERTADAMRREAIRNIRGVLDGGAKTITMYRSVPSDVKETQFRNGDWITPSRAYAEENARIHGWGDNYRVIEQEVSVESLTRAKKW